MTQEQKKEIAKLLRERISEFSSQKRAVAMLTNVSEATVIQMLKGNWESISDNMWRNIAKQIGFSVRGHWNYVPIVASKQLVNILKDAGESGNTYAVIANAGGSKSFTVEQYAKKNTNTFHVVCAEYFNRKVLLQEILSAMGIENTGYNVAEMMDTIVHTVMPMEEPVIQLDEIDKVNEQVLCFLITLYNRLHGRCALVITGTDYLVKRIERGVRMNKKGYKEIFSRIGRRFIHLKPITEEEVSEICKANGLKESGAIKQAWNECEGDLRRIERVVYKLRKKDMRIAA